MAASARPSKAAFETTVVIDRPIGEVWGLMTNWSQAAGWWPRVADVEGPDPVVAGGMVTFSYQGTPASAFIDVADRPNRLVIRRVNGLVSATFDYRLEPDGAATGIRLRADLKAEQVLSVVGPLLRRALAHTDRSQLGLLKHLAEPSKERSDGSE
jgi:uncharacterized protein YndB with AHSA1/START domain